MKKLSIILLALALAVFFAGSAMAFHEGDEGTAEGALGITGTYTLDGEINQDNAGGDSRWFDDDLEVVIRVNMLGVTGVIDLEISDDETFDGNDTEGDSSDSLIDNYWVEWNAMDNLKVKMGEYALTFGKAVFIYADPPAHHIGLIYSGLDNATLSFFLGKVDEGATTNDESSDDDIDSMSLLINVKGVDFFKKLDIIYVSATAADDATATFGDSASYIGLDTAFSAGPVAVA
ncbi:MAG: hypothetical protein JSV00_05785, partial [bacterium]